MDPGKAARLPSQDTTNLQSIVVQKCLDGGTVGRKITKGEIFPEVPTSPGCVIS